MKEQCDVLQIVGSAVRKETFSQPIYCFRERVETDRQRWREKNNMYNLLFETIKSPKQQNKET